MASASDIHVEKTRPKSQIVSVHSMQGSIAKLPVAAHKRQPSLTPNQSRRSSISDMDILDKQAKESALGVELKGYGIHLRTAFIGSKVWDIPEDHKPNNAKELIVKDEFEWEVLRNWREEERERKKATNKAYRERITSASSSAKPSCGCSIV